MGNGKEKCEEVDENVQCQLCDKEGHKAFKCPWLYFKCKEKSCGGLMLLKISEEEETYGKKILKCQYKSCKGFMMLEEEMQSKYSPSTCSSSQVPSSTAYTSPSQLGCFECRLYGHWAQNCPWKKIKCPRGCAGYMKLWTSGKETSKGWKFVKCINCGKFEWLSTLVARAGAKVGMDDLCKEFEKKM